MARVPTSDDVPQVGLRVTSDVIDVPTDASLRGRERLARTVTDVTERIAQAENEADLNRADLETAAELERIRERYANDNDWQTAPERARAEADAIMAARRSTLRGDATQRAWDARSLERTTRFDVQMRAQSRERGASLARAKVVDFGAQAREIAGDLSQPEDVRRLAVKNFGGLLASMEGRGLIDPDDAARMEQEFAQDVRTRVVNGLEAEVLQRSQLDPDDLAQEIEAAQGQWAVVPADTRQRWANAARQAGAERAVNDVLEETLRTGELVSEDDPRLAGRWRYLDEGARLTYTARAANAVAQNRAAAALGDLSGLSLPEIAARADEAQAGGNSLTGAAARAHLRAARIDPAAYVISQQPLVAAAARRFSDAVRARRAAESANASNVDGLRGDENMARMEYGRAVLAAQDALGVPAGQQRLYTQGAIQQFTDAVRRMPEADAVRYLTQDAPGTLEDEVRGQWLDQTMQRMALDELRETGFAARSEAPSDFVTAPAPPASERAATGADYATVRARVLILLQSSGGEITPEVRSSIASLAPADRDRLVNDGEIHPLLVGPAQ